MVAVMIVAGGVLLDRSALGTMVAVFVLVVPFERLFPRRPQPLRRPHLGTDIGYALAATPLQAAGVFAGVVMSGVSLLWVPGLLLRPLVQLIPPAPRLLVGLLLFDLLIYWVHRFSHEVPFLWRFHQIHHSTPNLDWVSGFRSHPFDGVLLAPAFVFLLAAGFSPQFSGVLLVVQVVTGLFLHANVRWRWRPLHKVVITPEFHHWHHANEPDAHNTNYSVFLPMWDLVFGTYFMPPARRPQRYGVSEPIPAGLVAQLWWPLRGLPNPVRMARTPRRALRASAAALRRGLRQLRAAAAHR